LHWPSSVALVLVGCNQFFGNAPAHDIDAAFFDATIDALPTCPTGGAPSYSRDFFQLAVDDCHSIQVAGGDMLALCGQNVAAYPAYGPIGHVLDAAPALAVQGQFEARLSRDGQRASFVVPAGTGLASVVVFHRSGASWVRDPDIVTAGDSLLGASEISNGPNAHVLVAYKNSLHELEEQAGAWIDIAIHAVLVTGISSAGPHLSGDALRLWFTDGPTYYFDRSELDLTFTARGTIAGSEGLEDMDLTDDCGLMYFPTLSRIWVTHPI
jgi:hypothetical protein